jgi:ribulose-5-phosphate 4-epimerase/fuculose-1-phosphate aldolase
MISHFSRNPAMSQNGQTDQSNPDAEVALRRNLAAAFRVAHHLGWNRGINNHITHRLTDRDDEFLMNPFGLGWDEITASNLVRTSLDGKPLSHPTAKLAPAGLNFHSGMLSARPDINCVIHVHPQPGVVMSLLDTELAIMDQTSCHIYGEYAYHDFEGFAEEEDEVPRILRDLGDRHLLIMRNHGLLSVGRNIGEAFQFMRRLIEACELHIATLATGAPVRLIAPEVLELTREQIAVKRQKPDYSDTEWKYHLRTAELVAPGFDE